MFLFLKSIKTNKNPKITHLLELPKYTTPTPPNADKNVKQQEQSFIASGNAKCTACLENGLAELNTLFPYEPATVLLGIYSRVEILCAPPNLHMNVYSSFIHNCQNLEGTKMSFSKSVDK